MFTRIRNTHHVHTNNRTMTSVVKTRSGSLIAPVALDSRTQESTIVSLLRDSDANMILHHYKYGESARYIISAVERAGLSRDDVFLAADVRCSDSHEIATLEDTTESIGSDMGVGSLDMLMVDPMPYIMAGSDEKDVKSRQKEVVNAISNVSEDATRFLGLSFSSTPDTNPDIDILIESLMNDVTSNVDPDRFVAIARAASSSISSTSKFWQISYDSLRPRLSFEAEDNVPFVFQGGTSDDIVFEMSPLENALNGLIHLETFVLAAIDEKRGVPRTAAEEEDIPEVVSKMEIPDDIEARNVAWGHTLAKNLAGIGSLHEWQYVRRSMIEPAMKDSIRLLNETDCDASKEWVKLYQARMSTLNYAMEEYMKHRDSDFAAHVLNELKKIDKAFENVLSLEEVAMRFLLASGFDTVVMPPSLRRDLELRGVMKNDSTSLRNDEAVFSSPQFKNFRIGSRVRNMSGSSN